MWGIQPRTDSAILSADARDLPTVGGERDWDRLARPPIRLQRARRHQADLCLGDLHVVDDLDGLHEVRGAGSAEQASDVQQR